jgi:hypothetical protein
LHRWNLRCHYALYGGGHGYTRAAKRHWRMSLRPRRARFVPICIAPHPAPSLSFRSLWPPTALRWPVRRDRLTAGRSKQSVKLGAVWFAIRLEGRGPTSPADRAGSLSESLQPSGAVQSNLSRTDSGALVPPVSSYHRHKPIASQPARTVKFQIRVDEKRHCVESTKITPRPTNPAGLQNTAPARNRYRAEPSSPG